MSETWQSGTGTPRPGGGHDETRGVLDVLKQEMAALANDMQAAAKEMRAQFAAALDDAKVQAANIASSAKEEIRGLAEEQKNYAAERVGGMARVVNRAADRLEGELPVAAHYVREAGTGVDSISNAIRGQNFDQLIDGFEDFAEKRPATSFVISMAAGFALARFLKSSSDGHSAGRGAGTASIAPQSAAGSVSTRPATASVSTRSAGSAATRSAVGSTSTRSTTGLGH